MPVTLRSLNNTPNSDTLNAISAKVFPNVASVGAGVANTVVQSAIVMPTNFKIRSVAVMLTAIDATAGLDSFNLVVGGLIGQTGQTYTQGNIAANSNADTYGYATNIAVVGNAVFGADVPFNVANTVAANPSGFSGNQSGQAVPNTGWVTLTTTGGTGLFVPTDYDAVYPAGVPLSLRVTSVASTGSISNLSITLAIVPVSLRGDTADAPGQTIVLPRTDY